jgi:hypothetical protein
MSARVYLSFCTIYRDQADYLAEWIEFHRLVGAERFFLYDNSSSDAHREVLAPYIEEGSVVLHEWPVKFPMALRSAFNHCLTEHGSESRWIAFIDIDEFLFSPTLEPVAELLPEYEEWPGVGVNWALYGSSGHQTRPAGLVIDNYLYRTDTEENGATKSIVDPARVAFCRNAHQFEYREGAGSAVDENKHPIDGWQTESVSFAKLRINHYYTKSEEDVERKFEAWSKSARPMERRLILRKSRLLNQVRDETITHYVPALRDALARRGLNQG